MKRVLIVNHYAVPPWASGGTRHFALAKWLKDHGWHATIVAEGSQRPAGDACSPGEARDRDRIEVIERVQFLWIGSNRGFIKSRGIGRIYGMLCFACRVATLDRDLLLGMGTIDAVIGSSVHPFAAAAGWILSRRLKVPFIFEVRDLWPETLVTMKKMGRASMVAGFLYWLELFLFKRADSIISPLPRISEYVAMRLGDISKVTVIPNGVDLAFADECQSRASPLPCSRQGFTFLYAGAMGNGNDIRTLLLGFNEFQRRNPAVDAGLRLVGSGSLKAQFESLARELAVRNVEFFDSVPKRDVYSVLRSADVLVITVPHNPDLYRFGVCANKMFDYLASGRVMISANSAEGDPVRVSGGGVNVPSGNPALLADAMSWAVGLGPAERQRLGQRGRDYVARSHDFKDIAGCLASLLDRVTRSGSPST